MKNLLLDGTAFAPKRVAAWISMVMGLAAFLPTSGFASESPVIIDENHENLPQKSYFTWSELIQIAASALCEVVQCGGVGNRSLAVNDEAAAVVEAVIDAYRMDGLVKGLTQSEALRGIDVVDYTLYLVDDPASTLGPGLAAEFRGALVEIRGDLVARLKQ